MEAGEVGWNRGVYEEGWGEESGGVGSREEEQVVGKGRDWRSGQGVN